MALPKTRISPEEYLDLERASETKHEYLNGLMYEVGSPPVPVEIFPNHLLITGNIFASLHAQLRQHSGIVFQTGLSIKSANVYVYPDVVVVRDKPKYEDNALINPTMIIEVLSNASAAYDLGIKASIYRSIVSLQEFLLVSQDKTHIDHFRLTEIGWLLDDASSPDAMINLPSIGCTLLLADVYEKVRFDDASAEQTPPADGDG